MKKYTVGPWTIHQNGASFSVHGNEPDCFACQGISKRAKLDCLIAAAPELLEALKTLDLLWRENEASAVEFTHAIDQARAAIAKATEGLCATNEFPKRTQHSWS